MLLLLLAAGVLHAGVQSSLQCRLTPEVIEVGAFYSGAAVRVEGAVAPGSQVIVVVSGSEGEERFNRKRRAGPIWLTSGRVKIAGVPSLLLRFSSAPVCTLLGSQAIAEHGLDEPSLLRRVRGEPRAPDGRLDPALAASFLALKKSDGSYRFGDGGVVIGADSSFALQFAWPRKAPPAEYAVRILEVRDGAVARQATLPLRVVRTGFPAWLSALAENRSSLYGITAILAGVLAGFGIDFLTTRLFGKKKLSASH